MAVKGVGVERDRDGSNGRGRQDVIIGLGLETIDVERFAAALQRRGGAFLKRLFTGEELAYCIGKRNSAMHLAARFAAKTAFFKAAGLRLPYRAVEVARKESGEPYINLDAGTRRALRGLGGFTVSLTISHTRGLALAAVLIERRKA